MSSRSFFRDGLSVFFTKVFVIGLSVVSMIIQARALGASGRGELATLLIYPQLFVAIAEGGMRQATVYFIGRKIIPDSQIFGSSIVYTMLSAAIFSTLIFCILSFSDQYDFSVLMMLASALILPLGLLTNSIRAVFLGKQKIRQFNTNQWLQKIILIAFLLGLYLLGALDVEAAIICILLSSFVGFLPSFYYFFKRFYTSLDFNRQALWMMLKKGAVYSIALFLIDANYKLDVLLLGWLSTSDEVGLYSVAVQVGELLWQLPAAIGIVVFSRSANDEHSPKWIEELTRSIRIALWATIFGAAAMYVIAPLLFDIAFGKEFATSVDMTRWLLPGLIVMVLFKLINMELAGKGKPFVSLFIMLPALAINVGLNYLLIPTMGGKGAAIASSASYGFAALAMLIAYTRMHGFNFLDFVVLRRSDIDTVISKVTQKFNKP